MNSPLLSRSNQNTRAVTLAEILVCLGIMALLVALLYPAVTTVISRGKDAKCLANHRSIMQATMAYTGDYGGTLPGNATNSLTAQKLSSYLRIEWNRNAKWVSLWYCPARSPGFDKYLFPNYAFTHELFGLWNAHGNPPSGRLPIKIAQINQPSKTAAFACVVGDYALYHAYAYTRTDPSNPNTAPAQLAPWHRGGTAITFMDGHSELVEAFPKTDKRRNWFSLNNPNVP